MGDEMWDDIWGKASEIWRQVFSASQQAEISSVFANGLTFLEEPLVRTVGLLLIVYLTIRAIAAIYGGEIQNGKYGPLGLRPHSAQALGEHDVRLPRALMQMGLDGVHATCEIFFAYNDRLGRRVERKLASISDARINVVPSPLTRVQTSIYGHEATDAIRALHSEDVVFPTSELETQPDRSEPTEPTVGAYLDKHEILKNWTDDDSALVISVHHKLHKRVADERELYITNAAEKLREAKEGNWWNRRRATALAR
jgi:hypothetical protein